MSTNITWWLSSFLLAEAFFLIGTTGHNFKNHSTPSMEKQEQPETSGITQNLYDEPSQIDAIAEKRGWFRPDPDEDAYPIVQGYINGRLDLDTAVEKLAEPVEHQFSTANNGRAIRRSEKVAASQRQYHSPKTAEKMWGVPLPEDELPPEIETDSPTAEGLLWELWYSVLHTARRIPWRDTTARDRLVDLVRAFKTRPEPPLPTQMTKALEGDWIWSSKNLWSGLNIFGAAARECWNDIPRPWDELCVPEVHAWTNINAFVAALTKEGVGDFSLYAIWALRDGVENDYKAHSLRASELDAYVPAAAVWIMVMGENIYQREVVWESSNTGGDPASGGNLRKGTSGFSGERWCLWKERFLAISQREDLLSETREIAAEAFKSMKYIEESAAEKSSGG